VQPKIETREDVIESRRKRRAQLESVLQRARKKLDDHNLGRTTLKPNQVEQFEKKIGAYEKQIEALSRELAPEVSPWKGRRYEYLIFLPTSYHSRTLSP
jgi:septal ring factor EnvC (AmiA/AmiB activator)